MDPDDVNELVDRYRNQRRAGSSVTPEEICRDRPDLLNAFREALNSLGPEETQTHAAVGMDSASLAESGQQGATIDNVASPSTGETKDFSTLGGGRAAPTRPQIQLPGYEITGELGHGGMGVVYLAEQLALKRLVALKMMRAGVDAEPEHIQRFRGEAEAVAHLHHPNIVQIFEIGEHDGCPFIALEYLDGGSLKSRLQQQPASPSEAADIVQTLARAIHHAHQRGIVHRDLKPANVLLDSDGTLKITDFGLAKRLEESQVQHTRTGMVVGTPSYMAPEQAEGKSQEIGPLTDVYALGAMLYEMLVGKPPFQGDSIMETLKKVTQEEPVPPTRVKPGIDRDLETICLKSLSKEKSGRYPSALALAQDLERYLSGEPILGRRKGIAAKAWRVVRRNVVLSSMVTGLVLALGGATWVFVEARTAGHVAELNRQFESALDNDTWPADHRESIQSLMAELAKWHPEQSEELERRFQERFVRQFRQGLRRPRLEADDIAKLEADLVWLSARDAEVTKTLELELRGRLRDWQSVFELKAPFENQNEVFAARQVIEADGALKSAGARKLPLPTRIPSQGIFQAEVVLETGWRQGAHVGLALNYRDRGTRHPLAGHGYTFLVTPLVVQTLDGIAEGRELEPSKAATTFDQAGGRGEMQILRDGVVLRRQPIQLPDGTLQLLARREGDRLHFNVSGAAPMESFDLAPLGGDPGVLAVYLPTGVRLKRLRADRQSLPATPSPLERADALFSEGNAREALPLYEEQARLASDRSVMAEPLCKAGFCLLQLNRGDEAITKFENALSATGERWPLVAAVQLCINHLQRKDFDQVEAALASLRTRFDTKLLALYVPDHLRLGIFQSRRVALSLQGHIDANETRRLELTVQLADLFQHTHAAHHGRLDLVWCYALNRRDDLALRMAQEALVSAMEHSGNGRSFASAEEFAHAHRWYGWLMNRNGQTGQAIEQISTRIRDYSRQVESNFRDQNPDRVRMIWLVAYLDRARAYAAIGDWKKAEDDLDVFLERAAPEHLNYMFYTAAHVMKGFCQERRGDKDGAIVTWKQGLYPAYLKHFPDPSRQPSFPRGRHAILDLMMLSSLSDELSDRDGERMFQGLVDAVGKDTMFQQAASLFVIKPSVFRQVYQTPRGREAARQLAFLNVPPADYYRLPPTLVLYEKIRQELFQSKPSEAEEAILWTAVLGMGEQFFSGQLSKSQMMQAGLTWKGSVGIFGWGSLAPTLEPRQRGPMAYLFGRRFLALKRPQDAITFFQTAVSDSPADSPLHTLARTELSRLSPK